MGCIRKPADLSKIKRISINKRENLVKVSDFASVPAKGTGFNEFLTSLSNITHRTNAAGNLVKVVQEISIAHALKRPITWALGPHIIKYGLSPLIIHLMDQNVVQCILFNGASAIHDVEIALIGETSEEMAGHISAGDFGMAEETGKFINQAARQASDEDKGFGGALGEKILSQKLPYAAFSILAQAAARNIPLTVHAAIGTDIVHMHPDMDGAATGKATFFDFRLFVSILQDFLNGGVHLNIGSTVILPEIFVKAMTCANNLNGRPASGYTTVNIDHLSEYRPLMNVVRRGSLDGGNGYEIIGRMEILIPLLTRLIVESISVN